MKSEYRMYGRDSEPLAQNLSDSDKKILNDYLRFCATTAGPTKVRDYRRYMLQFIDVMEKPLDQITRDDAIDFWGLVNYSQHENATKIMIRRTIKRFLKWFYRNLDMIECLKNPIGPLVNPTKINKSVLFKPQEAKQMLHLAERLRDKALFAILAETAARPQEIRDLCWGDINWDDKEVHLYSTKTTHDRDLPIYNSIKYLKMWHEQWAYPDPQYDDYIFPAMARANQPRKKPISTAYINRIIQRLAVRVGIKRKVNTYLLRHSRLTELYKLGVKGIEHNKFAGHAPGSKHQNVYVHLDNNDLKKALVENVYSKNNLQQQTMAQPTDVQTTQNVTNIQVNNNGNISSIEAIQQQMLLLQQQLFQMQAMNMQSKSVEHY